MAVDGGNVTYDEAFLNESRQNEVYATHIAFFALMMIIVPCRFFSSRLTKKTLSWDDWLAYFAAFNTVGVFITSMLWLRFGLGRHLAWVMQDDPKNIENFFRAIVANEIMYTTALACARLSLVAFFYHIFGVSSMRYFLHGFVAFIIAWAISTYVPSIRTCWPISSFWDGTNQNCIDLSKFYVGVAIGGIITDIGLMIIPLPYIWALKVPLYHKILIAIMLVFGSFACFVTIIRLTKVITVDLTDPTWGTVDLMIWTGMEVYSAVICCCLPTMRPLIKLFWKKLGLKQLSSTGNTDPSKPVSNGTGMWGNKSRQNSRHLTDGVLASNADEMELTKHAYYELHSDNAHCRSQDSITVHQQV
ncbi:related to integral membrane protein [Fusarium oxysporum]|uniref:Related to integral membrane protein n=1 Tax=Fusarium oxysporum TaxID=5507 RepID=A0A2H3TTR1_FUSOX|nr:related to integral membrane protein [Fusarium oxysporum]